MFIGRKKELSQLTSLYQTDKFQFAVIYGRRRIGKTALINEFTKDKKTIYFTANEENVASNLKRFNEAISTAFPEYPIFNFTNFEQALKAINQLSQNERVVLVIDEYPYLATADKSFASILQLAIDHYFKNSKLFLILCGSAMSFMERQVMGYKSPLYGRRTAQFKLKPFTLAETQKMLPGFDKEDAFRIRSITGGIPLYLSFMSDKVDILTNIEQTLLNRNAYLFEEPSNLLKQELRDPANYNSILQAIAYGASRANDIAMRSHIEANTLSNYLNNLIDLGIIEKIIPATEVDKPNSRKGIYRIQDGLFRFWFKFIAPNVSLIEHDVLEPVIANIQENLPDFMGQEFEKMAHEYMWNHALDRNIIPLPFKTVGNWWGTSKKQRKQIELDVMGFSEDKLVGYFGKSKWKNEPITSKVLQKLLENSSEFSYPKKTYFLFSKSGFTEGCVQLAKKVDCHLINFEEM